MSKVNSPIEMHHFCHPLYKASGSGNDTVTLELPITHNIATLHKSDVIALAKHFKLTAHDIDCQAIKDMQDEIDLADEVHFDELAECKSTVMKHNKGVN